jgi:hypothetical protein
MLDAELVDVAGTVALVLALAALVAAAVSVIRGIGS